MKSLNEFLSKEVHEGIFLNEASGKPFKTQAVIKWIESHAKKIKSEVEDNGEFVLSADVNEKEYGNLYVLLKSSKTLFSYYRKFAYSVGLNMLFGNPYDEFTFKESNSRISKPELQHALVTAESTEGQEIRLPKVNGYEFKL